MAHRFGFRTLCALLFALCAFLYVSAFAVGAAAAYSRNWNSSEVGCDGSNANYLWCHDMETSTTPNTRRGWLRCEADIGCADDPALGQANKYNHGWNGDTSLPDAGDPTGAINAWGRCGSLGAAGTDCAFTSDQLVFDATTGGGGNYGKHRLWQSGNESNQIAVTDIYVRYYLKQLPGFQIGHEKMLTLQNDAGYQAGLWNKTGAGTGKPVVESGGSFTGQGLLTQNQGNDITLGNGTWYALEYHLKINTTAGSCTHLVNCNGIYELWINDCGANGLGCPGGTGSQTLRASYTTVRWSLNPASDNIDTVWLENWGNPSSGGEEYYDQFIVSRTRIGWAQLAGGGPSTFQQGTADPLSPAETVRRQAGKTQADAIAPQEDLGSRKGQAVKERLGIRRKLTP